MTSTLTAVPSAPPGAGAVSLHGLRKVYPGGAVAVEDLDLAIGPGEFVTLLGPSGCGKTTTLRMIAGFETPTAGHIEVDGTDVVTIAPHRRPMSMVFQSYALFPHMSVWDNVAFGLRVHNTSRAETRSRVSSALSSMGLSALGDRAPNQLSGGQQQRVALARALVTRPKVLLFDEPLSNLDAKLRAQMRTEIRRIQHEAGITSIFVTHDQDEAMTMSDKIVVMSNGRIEQVGTPAEIYRAPTSHFVADFIGQANFLDAEVRGVSGGCADVIALGQHMSVRAGSDDHVDRPELRQVLLRPESIRLVDATDTSAVVLGTVRDMTYYGGRAEYVVEVGDTSLCSSVANPARLTEPGTRVGVTFAPTDAWLLPRPTS